MLVEAVGPEMGVAVDDVDDDGPPGDDVALLGLVVEGGVVADDVGAETFQGTKKVRPRFGKGGLGGRGGVPLLTVLAQPLSRPCWLFSPRLHRDTSGLRC